MTFEPFVANGIATPAIKVEDAKAVVVGMTERKPHGMCGKHRHLPPRVDGVVGPGVRVVCELTEGCLAELNEHAGPQIAGPAGEQEEDPGRRGGDVAKVGCRGAGPGIATAGRGLDQAVKEMLAVRVVEMKATWCGHDDRVAVNRERPGSTKLSGAVSPACKAVQMTPALVEPMHFGVTCVQHEPRIVPMCNVGHRRDGFECKRIRCRTKRRQGVAGLRLRVAGELVFRARRGQPHQACNECGQGDAASAKDRDGTAYMVGGNRRSGHLWLVGRAHPTCGVKHVWIPLAG